MVGEHSTASRKIQTFIFRTEAGFEAGVKRVIKRLSGYWKMTAKLKLKNLLNMA